MEDFFGFTFFSVGDYNFTLANFVMLFVVLIATHFTLRFTKKHIKKYIQKYIPETELKIEGKKITLNKLLIQIIYVISFLLLLQSLQVMNPEFKVYDIITFKIIDVGKFFVSIYHIFLIAGLILASRIVVNILKLFLSKASKNSDSLDDSTQYVLIQFTKYIIYIVIFLIVFQSFGLDVTGIIVGSAALLVGVGLGLQDFFRDVFSGIILLFEGSIKVNDIIEVSDGSHPELVAKVLKINIRTTKIETRDGNFMIIPNSKLTQDYVHNWSFGSSLTRFKIKVGVAYGSDTELVRKLLIQAAESHDKVYKSRPIIVRLIDFGDSALEMDLVFWAEQSWKIELVKSEIRFEIDRLFRENGVVIPFPQRDIHHINHTPK